MTRKCSPSSSLQTDTFVHPLRLPLVPSFGTSIETDRCTSTSHSQYGPDGIPIYTEAAVVEPKKRNLGAIIGGASPRFFLNSHPLHRSLSDSSPTFARYILSLPRHPRRRSPSPPRRPPPLPPPAPQPQVRGPLPPDHRPTPLLHRTLERSNLPSQHFPVTHRRPVRPARSTGSGVAQMGDDAPRHRRHTRILWEREGDVSGSGSGAG